jgi:heme-degrading monooxygenase HmoA
MPPLPWTAAPAADAVSDDVVVMASLLRLDSLRRAPGFLRAAMAIRRQVLGADGAVGVALNTALPRLTFFTLSAWRDREALNGFVRSEPHVSTMRRYRPVMADARFVFWNSAADTLPPSWSEAERRLRDAASNSELKSPIAKGDPHGR